MGICSGYEVDMGTSFWSLALCVSVRYGIFNVNIHTVAKCFDFRLLFHKIVLTSTVCKVYATRYC